MHVTMHTKILIVPSTEIQQELSDVNLLSLAFIQNIAFIERYIGKRKKSVTEKRGRLRLCMFSIVSGPKKTGVLHHGIFTNTELMPSQKRKQFKKIEIKGGGKTKDFIKSRLKEHCSSGFSK